MSAVSRPLPNRAALTFQRALSSFQHGHLDSAEALCTEILQADPRHADALHLQGLVVLQKGDAQRSIALIRRSLALQPAQPVAQMNLANALLRAGKAHAALLACDAALGQRPNYAEALNARGNALVVLERPAEALAVYEQALALRPDLAQLYSNRGNALRVLGRLEEALASYGQALERQQALREALLGAAGILKALGRSQEGLANCERVLRQNAQDADALHLRGKIYLDLKRREAALGDFDRALTLRPDSAEIAIDRGNALCQLGRIEDALAVYQSALERAPADPDAWFNCAQALLLLGRYHEALSSYQEAIRLRSDDAKFHYYHGKTLRLLKRPLEALDSFARALALNPRYAEALTGRGQAFADLDRSGDALTCFEQALELDPRSLEALSNRGRMLMAANQDEEAVSCFERLLELEPQTGSEFNQTLGHLLYARLKICDWREYEPITAAIEAGLREGRRVTGPSLYTASGLSPELHLRCARGFVEENWSAITAAEAPRHTSRHERIRVAYVSADYREHPVSMLLAPVLEQHDHTRFETFGVSIRKPDDSALARRVVGAFDRFIDATESTDAQVAALLRELEIDICVDLTGYTAHLRSGIFAHRAAPIQVNYLGYPGSLGAPYIDYIIADPTLIPEADQRHYSEKIAYLPYTYLPPGDPRGSSGRIVDRTSCGLPDHAFVFCGFNTHSKLSPPVFDVWMRLLQSVEGSVLWLSMGKETITRNLQRAAASRGVAPERIVFAPRLPALEDHLARYAFADLFLDTLPYNAHTTASDALWAGLPVLTSLGNSFAGRVAAGLLTALDLPELITESLQDYEARALQLARAPGELSGLRARIQHAREAQHPLFDAARFCRYLESAFVTMWGRSLRGKAPASFQVQVGPDSDPALIMQV